MECAEGAVDQAAFANKKDVAPPPQVEAKQTQPIVVPKKNVVPEAKAPKGKEYKPEGLQNFALFPEKIRKSYE